MVQGYRYRAIFAAVFISFCCGPLFGAESVRNGEAISAVLLAPSTVAPPRQAAKALVDRIEKSAAVELPLQPSAMATCRLTHLPLSQGVQ